MQAICERPWMAVSRALAEVGVLHMEGRLGRCEGRGMLTGRPRPPGACKNEGRSSVAPTFDNHTHTTTGSGLADLGPTEGIS